MQKLAVMPNHTVAQAVADRLAEKGIEATLSNEAGHIALYLGGTQVAIWIPDDADEEVAAATLQAMQQEDDERRSETHCPGCDYVLQGHDGEVDCPECGEPVNAGPASLECAACGEVVPGTFSTCWNCGADTHDAPPASPEALAEAASASRRPVARGMRSPIGALGIAALVFVALNSLVGLHSSLSLVIALVVGAAAVRLFGRIEPGRTTSADGG